MNAVETRDLHVYYGENHVIKGVSLEIPEKCIFALMGPSGCGKSTFLRTLNRIIELREEARVEGEVRIYGKNIYSPDVDPIEIRKNVGMVFQEPNPFPHLTIYENVALGVKLNKLVSSKEELDKRVEWALKKASLWGEVKDRLRDYPSNLSGGQRQRLVIARALAMKPKIILMDEPTANIDPVGTAKVEELLFELKKDYTIILVTHSPHQAARVSDYVGFLYLGELIETGPTKKVFENPEHELTEKYVTGVL
ncbi:phosphate ABC transporter ATP-binding protein [Thermococcus sp. P6]|uniref:phosphate ABC transporter ATP-binding protein n=1 Tax=Thermococcus sp. P6 TaxID=122420 RepID=UPI000B59A85E|nr:phosphate ABC transporter ATP-binding protein [Thermococcus sp. P6]ASJ09806.1 phosphate ABC transporter ATP-binding protein [Thermococcus sp. P6]